MKKLLVLGLVLGMMVMGSVMVFADETETFETNMTEAVYSETRLAQIEAALENGLITEDQAMLLIAHIEDVSANQTFGNGPSTGDGSATCILGDDALGIFRSDSAGTRSGSGNGVSEKLADGNGNGAAERLADGNGNGGQGNFAKGNVK